MMKWIVKLRLECMHLAEASVYYDPKTNTQKFDHWAGKVMYCDRCRRYRKVKKVGY
jgi:hypothetical protein